MNNASESHDFFSNNIPIVELEKKLPLIFNQVVVLNREWLICGVGTSVLSLLHYELEELLNQPAGILVRETNFREKLSISLQEGAFTNMPYLLKTSEGHILLVNISGITLSNGEQQGYTVLRIDVRKGFQQMHQQLQARSMELEGFLYRVSHDLRGPLASILGLAHIALLKEHECSEEVVIYLNEMKKLGEKLDATLKNILFIANSGVVELEHFDFHNAESLLRNLVYQYSCEQDLTFELTIDPTKPILLSRIYFFSIIKNLLVGFLESAIKGKHQHIQVKITSLQEEVLITVHASGFFLENEVLDKFSKEHLSFVEVLRHSQLINLYAARKIVEKLAGRLQTVLQNWEQQIFVRLPIDPEQGHD